MEFFTIVVALILEGYQMTFGSLKPLTDWLTAKDKDKIALRILVSLILFAGSILYIIYGFVWMFSDDIPIRAAGITLMGLSAIALLWFRLPKREKPAWYTQLDSMLSMVSVGIVALIRIRGC